MTDRCPTCGHSLLTSERASKMGKARAAKLSPERRREIAAMGAAAARKKREAEQKCLATAGPEAHKDRAGNAASNSARP